MASFTDEIAHFNPYVAQLPVDDYVNVGMQLQTKYDQGVAKVQNYIDTVSGLQVAGSANSEYLRNKVGQLESRVSKVVGSDFSKTNLQSQVGQLASSIARDPVVQAGMSSAIRIDKYQKAWEDMEKNHPDQYSSKNKEYFDQYVNDYMKKSQTKAGLVYNGPTDATPYVDYYSKLDKSLKELDPSITTSVSPAGEFMYKIDKSSTISKNQIDGVINSELLTDPRALQQMQIDAWHSYRSFDAPQMFEHVNQSFQSMIDSHTEHLKYWQDVIKSNPNDYQTVTAAQKKILDANSEINNLNTNRNTYLKALNDGRLDEVKQSVFNDSVRQGLVLKYEKSNVTTDLKNNENSIMASKNQREDKKIYLDFIKEGLDPDTGLGITSSSKYYIAWLNVLEAKKKTARAAKVGEEGPDQSVAVAGIVPDTYTESQHNDAITNLSGQVNETLTKLRSYYPNMSDNEWKSYQATQEGKYQAGDGSVDPKYAQYKSIVQPQEALLSTYVDISKKIHSEVSNKVNLSGALDNITNIQNLPITDETGKTTISNVAYPKKLVEQAINLRTAILSHQTVTNAAGPGGVPGIVFPTKKEIDSETDKYKGDPNYKYIVALANSDKITPLISKLNSTISQSQSLTSSKFADFGKTTSYNAQPIIGKKEEIDQIKRLTATAAGQTGETIEADKINPLNYYNNDQGKLVIQYQKDKDTKTYQVEVPAARNILGEPDPYQPIARVIDLSPTQSTPLNPKEALSSVNGKIKYVLHKDPLGGQYELRLWNKGALYTIPSFSLDGGSFAKPNIGSYVERVEQLSKLPPEQLEALMKASFGQ